MHNYKPISVPPCIAILAKDQAFVFNSEKQVILNYPEAN